MRLSEATWLKLPPSFPLPSVKPDVSGAHKHRAAFLASEAGWEDSNLLHSVQGKSVLLLLYVLCALEGCAQGGLCSVAAISCCSNINTNNSQGH